MGSSSFSWRSSDLLGGFVSPGENAFASIVHALSTGSHTDFNGRGYIGLEFESTLGTHYGYLDIEAGPGFDGITFYGWAYETQPSVPLFAGQVPEPSRILLLSIGSILLLSRRHRKPRQNRVEVTGFRLSPLPHHPALASFSVVGPTDDGRIKPDLVAVGTTNFALHHALGLTHTINGQPTAVLTEQGDRHLIRFWRMRRGQ